MFGLTIATVIFASILIIKGSAIVMGGRAFTDFALKFLYQRQMAIALWAVAVCWTLWETVKLGPSDFGSFKPLLFLIFAGLGISSVWMLRDYLIVRAVAVLNLYISWYFLKAAFLQPEWTRVFFVVPVYLFIIISLWFSVAPWRVRDLLMWIRNDKQHGALLGWGQLGYGVWLLVVAATYRFFI
jgi:hypothetical protein